MAAKDYCLSLLKDNRTKLGDRDARSTDNGTYSNIDLNSFNKYSQVVQPNKGDILKDKSVNFQHHNIMDNCNGRDRKCDGTNSLMPCRSATSCPPKEDYINDKKNEHRRLKGEKNTNNKCTLLLHISAYENSISRLSSIDNSKMLTMKNKFKNVFSSKAMYESLFEIPRQQEDMSKQIEENKPEIMAFKSTQKLLDVNQQTPVKRKPSAVEADTLNGTNISNPFHEMPSQLDLNVVLRTPQASKRSSSFNWTLEQQSQLFPAQIDSNFKYDSPMNSDYDSRNQSFWHREIIAPSPVHQSTRKMPSYEPIDYITTSTQTDVTIPVEFDLSAVLGDSLSGMNYSMSERVSLNCESISFDHGQHRQPNYDLGEECHQLNMLKIEDISPINSTYSEN